MVLEGNSRDGAGDIGGESVFKIGYVRGGGVDGADKDKWGRGGNVGRVG